MLVRWLPGSMHALAFGFETLTKVLDVHHGSLSDFRYGEALSRRGYAARLLLCFSLCEDVWDAMFCNEVQRLGLVK